jgi:hypothetical protein
MRLIKAICVIIAFSLLGCAKPPRAEMESATLAVARAENDADAVLYAGNSLLRARDALNRMNVEANSKRYDAAKTYAAEATAAADKALADGRAGAIRARDEAAALLAGLAPVIIETEQGLQSAMKAELDLDFAALDRDFQTARQNAAEAEAALSENEYQTALDMGRSAQAGLSDINQQLSGAAMAVSRKK